MGALDVPYHGNHGTMLRLVGSVGLGSGYCEMSKRPQAVPHLDLQILLVMDAGE